MTNMQGITFGNEGPIMSGTWYNPHTGDAFTVRDSFFEDNEYVVTTTDGRYMKYNQLQNYIQSDMKLEDLKRMKMEKAANAVKDEPLPAEVAGLLEQEDPYSSYMIPDDDIITKPLGNLYVAEDTTRSIRQETEVRPATKSMNEAIIEKALKNASKPDFTIKVIWDNFPKKQIEMLKDIMDIPEEEIVDWYLDNIQLQDVVDAIRVSITNRIIGDVQVDSTTNDLVKESELYFNNVIEEPAEKPKKKPRKTSKS